MTLVVGLATDLDQRLLPDELTLPVIPVALLLASTGQNPLVGAELPIARGRRCDRRSGRSCYLPSIPFGAGAFGLGDVKLLVGGRADDRRRPGCSAGCSPGCSRPGVVLAVLLRDAPDRAARRSCRSGRS